MDFVNQFWGGFQNAIGAAPLFLALATAGLWADRHYGRSEEVKLTLVLIVGFVIGIVLPQLGISLPFEPWMFAIPLIVLGIIVAFQSSAVSSSVAMIILLVIGVYFGFGRGYDEAALPSTIGAAAAAIMAMASGVGLGVILSGFVGSFFVRVVGVVVAVIGVLMVADVNF